MIELQHAVTQILMDSKLFPHLAEDISLSVIYLYGAILQLRKNHAVLVSWDHYLQMASDAGVAEVDIEQATAVLEFKVGEKPLVFKHPELNPFIQPGVHNLQVSNWGCSLVSLFCDW